MSFVKRRGELRKGAERVYLGREFSQPPTIDSSIVISDSSESKSITSLE